jgi:tRNA threonylcarbamoyladenosine biosynthesis protein TsaB
MIVAIDTAGPVIGVASRDARAGAVRVGRITRGAETLLVPWLEEAVHEIGRSLAEVRGVAVTTGPGAFTGIRVGLATAGGLALALGVPVYPCSSLATRGGRVGTDRLVLAWLDARKSRVYVARYRSGAEVCAMADVAPEAALLDLEPGFVATGEGAIVYRELIEAAGGSLAEEADHPAVDVLADLALAGRLAAIDPAELTPTYLREPDALPSDRRM